jgi:hypothetical protein
LHDITVAVETGVFQYLRIFQQKKALLETGSIIKMAVALT